MCERLLYVKGEFTLDSSTVTRRERRAEARRTQILSAAAAVFSRKGYERATTREIAAAADLAEGTLYNYFTNKRDLLIGVAQNYADEVTQAISQSQAEDLDGLVAQLIANRFRHRQERRLFMLFMQEAHLNQDVYQYYVQEALARIIHNTEQLIEQAIEAGKMRPVDPGIAARTISAAIMGFSVMFEFSDALWDGLKRKDGHPITADWLGEQVADLFLHGLEK
ncbi:MAG: TetR/AcrR family transcriptional regulator [Anaerolineae bacterium]|nr:TetR/AcrR family transcriptional regulator [Anaerolineae bacterium]